MYNVISQTFQIIVKYEHDSETTQENVVLSRQHLQSAKEAKSKPTFSNGFDKAILMALNASQLTIKPPRRKTEDIFCIFLAIIF